MQLVKSLIYAIFDEKLGPTAKSWLPSSLDEDKRENIALSVMNITSNMEEAPTAIAVIPLTSIRAKTLVRFIKFQDDSRRGGLGEAALILVYDEIDDSVFYKYIKQFEDVFEKYANKASNLQISNAPDDIFNALMDEFSEEIQDLLNDLKDQELTASSASAFPSTDKDDPGLQYKYKMAICGDPNVGKTSIVIQFTEKAFRKTYLPTLGVNITEKSLIHDDKPVKFVLWDIAGQAKFNRMRRHFYTGSAGVIFVFDLTNPNSLQSIKDWYTDVKNNLERDFHGLILGNKCDLKEERAIDKKKLEALLKELDLPYFETSAKTGANIDAVFHHFAGNMLCSESRLQDACAALENED